jgi:hypothetical protein
MVYIAPSVEGLDPYALEPGTLVYKHKNFPIEIHSTTNDTKVVIKSPLRWGYSGEYFELKELKEKFERGQKPERQVQLDELKGLVWRCCQEPEAWSGDTEFTEVGRDELNKLFLPPNYSY